MKIKNKTRFRVLCALYVIGYLFFCILGGMNSGMMISDSPALAFAAIYYGLPVGVRNLSVSMFVWIILSFFLVLAILWQTNLSKQIHKAKILKGGIRKANQAPYIVKGFRLWDKVLYNGQECFISGRRSSGYFALRKLDGTAITNSISFKKLQLLEPATNYLIERM